MTTMQIKVLEAKFLDGQDAFFKDEIRVVDYDRGKRFVENGWAEDVSGEIATGDRQASHGKTLKVQDIQLNVADKVGV